MDVSDNVSLVALVVSLVALIVSLLQALQQYFATAEGYRNCAPSVIGPWHRTRHRRFVPSEFRFETVYDAPLIRLVSPLEKDRLVERYGGERVHGFIDRKPSRLLKETMDPYSLESLTENWLTRLQSRIRDLCFPTAKQPENVPRDRAQEDSLVSWIFFLRELYDIYMSAFPQARYIRLYDTCADIPLTSGHLSTNPRTYPVIIQRRVHWDFIGSGITRPLAMTTVGDIAALALRMGMQWRVIEPQDLNMQAVGNGFSLTLAHGTQRGLILTFSAVATHSEVPQIVPSQAADKMLFGILPGDANLVKRDFHMIRLGNKRENSRDDRGCEWLLSEILTPRGSQSTTGVDTASFDIKFDSLELDLKKLLCPFFPLQGLSQACVQSPLMPDHHVGSLLFFLESRVALWQQLAEEVQRRSSQVPGSPPKDADLQLLREVQRRLDVLEDAGARDFYEITLTPSLGAAGGEELQQKLQFLDRCRDAFDTCTAALVDRGWGRPADEGGAGGPTRYAMLAAAHTCVANKAFRKGDQEFEKKEAELKAEAAGQRRASTGAGAGGDTCTQDDDEAEEEEIPSRETWARTMGLQPDAHDGLVQEYLSAPEYWFRMCAMVECVRDGDVQAELVRRRRRGRSTGTSVGGDPQRSVPAWDVSEDAVGLAWWLMMARGVAWDMGCYREEWPDDAAVVPSALYGDQTPVMLA